MPSSPPRPLAAALYSGPVAGSGGLFCAPCNTSCPALLWSLLLCLWAVVIFAPALPLAHAATQAAAAVPASAAVQPYGGSLSREAATHLARAAAYVQALQQAMRQLESNKAALFGATSARRREALANAVHRPHFTVTPPPGTYDTKGEVRVDLRLDTPSRTLNQRVRETLLQRDLLDLREAFVAQLRQSAEEGRELARRMLEIRELLRRDNTAQGAKAHTTPGRAESSDAELSQRPRTGEARQVEQNLAYVIHRLEALWLLDDVLTRLRGVWREPAAMAAQLRKAIRLDARNPLLWTALGEVQLQMDQPQNALESLNNALVQEPDMARALYMRGLAHLRLQHSALAEADLSAALRLQPGNAAWLRARGAVRMIREDFSPMCDDFAEACALGDCEGLAAARKRSLCLPESPLQ